MHKSHPMLFLPREHSMTHELFLFFSSTTSTNFNFAARKGWPSLSTDIRQEYSNKFDEESVRPRTWHPRKSREAFWTYTSRYACWCTGTGMTHWYESLVWVTGTESITHGELHQYPLFRSPTRCTVHIDFDPNMTFYRISTSSLWLTNHVLSLGGS